MTDNKDIDNPMDKIQEVPNPDLSYEKRNNTKVTSQTKYIEDVLVKKKSTYVRLKDEEQFQAVKERLTPGIHERDVCYKYKITTTTLRNHNRRWIYLACAQLIMEGITPNIMFTNDEVRAKIDAEIKALGIKEATKKEVAEEDEKAKPVVGKMLKEQGMTYVKDVSSQVGKYVEGMRAQPIKKSFKGLFDDFPTVTEEVIERMKAKNFSKPKVPRIESNQTNITSLPTLTTKEGKVLKPNSVQVGSLKQQNLPFMSAGYSFNTNGGYSSYASAEEVKQLTDKVNSMSDKLDKLLLGLQTIVKVG